MLEQALKEYVTQNDNSVIIYLPSCNPKSVCCCLFFLWNTHTIFFFKEPSHRLLNLVQL